MDYKYFFCREEAVQPKILRCFAFHVTSYCQLPVGCLGIQTNFCSVLASVVRLLMGFLATGFETTVVVMHLLKSIYFCHLDQVSDCCTAQCYKGAVD